MVSLSLFYVFLIHSCWNWNGESVLFLFLHLIIGQLLLFAFFVVRVIIMIFRVATIMFSVTYSSVFMG